MNGGSESGGSGGGTPTGERRGDREESSSQAEERVELLCNDQVPTTCNFFVLTKFLS